MFGYPGCAIAYFVLLAAGLTVWRRRLAGSSLIVAFAAEGVWAAVDGLSARGVTIAPMALLACEYLRPLAWATVLVRCLSERSGSRIARQALRILGVLIGSVAAVLMGSIFDARGHAANELLRYWPWAGLALSIGGLILVEQVARNTRTADEWSFRYVWLAIGGLFAWDCCLDTVALLHGSLLDVIWSARGGVNTLLGALLAVGLCRISGWRAAAFLSPRLVFFNATLLGAAVYILAMAVASYYVRALPGSGGGVGQVVFLAGSLIVLAVAVLSEQVRARVRVSLAKHFFPYRYDYRTVWRTLTRALSDEDGTPVYERAAKVVASTVGCRSVGLWLRNPHGTLLPMAGDLAVSEIAMSPTDTDFWEHLRRNEWIVDLEESRRTSHRRAEVPSPPGWAFAQSHLRLILPLISQERLIGVLGLGRPLAQLKLTWEEIDLLRAAGRQMASFLELMETGRQLAEVREFEALNRLSAIIMHDLRHLIAQQALILQNAARHRGNPEFFEDAMLTIESSVKRMGRLMDELRAGPRAQQGSDRVELSELCAEAVRRCSRSIPSPSLVVRDDGLRVIANRERLSHALAHIIENGQEATSQDGSIVVTLQRRGTHAVIEIEDTGCGMDAQFIRTRLFRPFQTTKEMGGMGLGTYQARELARGCRGELSVESEVGRGTRFVFTLPLAPEPGHPASADIERTGAVELESP